MSPPSAWTFHRLSRGIWSERSLDDMRDTHLLFLTWVVTYLLFLWRLVLPLVWSSPDISVVHPTHLTLEPILLRSSLVLYSSLMSGRFPSRIIFPSRCLSCVPPLPFPGTWLTALMVFHIHSFIIFIPERWSFYLASSTGFTRLNFFPTYGTSQLSFPFQNQARIILCLGIFVQSL